VTAPRIAAPRLDLIAGTAALSQAELSDRAAFARMLSAEVPAEWPPEFYDTEAIRFTAERLAHAPHDAGWWCWYAVERPVAEGKRHLVGVGGFKGPPGGDRLVEIGYSFVAAARGRGLATEFVRALAAWALAQPAVDRVIAETLPELAPSIRVLERCGFRFAGNGAEPGVIRYELRQPASGV